MAILPTFLREPQDDGDETRGGQQNQIEIQRQVEALFDADPSFLDDPNAPEVEPEPEDTVGPGGRTGSRRVFRNIANSVYGGITKAVDETVELGRDLLVSSLKVNKIGQAEVGDPEVRARSLAWFDEHQDVAPFGDDFREKYIPREDKLLYSMIEVVSQFSVGMVGFAKIIKPVQMVGKLGTALKVGRQAFIEGGAAFTVFAPHEGRLADLINDRAPEWLSNPILRYLASDDTDSNLEARFKNALEFAFLGLGLHTLWTGVRIGKRALMRQNLTGPLKKTPKQLAEEIAAIAKEEAAAAREAFGVVENVDGTWTVIDQVKGPQIESAAFLDLQTGKPIRTGGVHNPDEIVDLATRARIIKQVAEKPETAGFVIDGKYRTREETAALLGRKESTELAGRKGGEKLLKQQKADAGDITSKEIDAAIIDPDLTFTSEGEARAHSAAMNFAKRNVEMPKGKMSDPARKEWKAATEKMNEAKTLEEAAHAIDSGDVPMSYTQTVDEAITAIQDMADAVVLKGTTETVARGEMIKLAEGIFPNMTADEVVSAMGHVFGETKRLPETIVAMRGWMVSQTNRTKVLSLMADLNPNNPIVNEELAHALDSLLKMYERVVGTGTNVGRSLNAFSVEITPEVASKITNSLDEVVQIKRVADDLAQKGADRAALDAAEKELLAVVKRGEKDIGIEVNPEFSLRSRAEAVEKGYQGLREVEVLESGVAKSKALRAPQQGRKSTAGLTRREIRALARNVFLSDTPWETLKLITAPRDVSKAIASRAPRNVVERILQAAIRWRMNAMLSGPVTQMTNATMNTAFMFQRPAEYMWAGVDPINALFNGGFRPELSRMGWDIMTAFKFELNEAWRMGAKAWKVGDNILDPGVNHTGRIQKALKRAGNEADNTYQGGLGWLELIMDSPTRLLMASDEMFQQLTYRATHRAQLLARGRELGVKDIGRYVADGMEMGFDGGRGINPSAIESSRIATFKNALEYGFGKSLQQAANNNYLIKSIFPFVRTPTNLFRQSWRRTPIIGAAQRQWREDFLAGGDRRAIAMAQQEMGVAFMAMGYMLVQSGDVTGRGPQDPDLRRQWLQAGNKPWSFRIMGTDAWISYRRADPVMSQIGVLADVNMAMSEMTEDDLALVTSTILGSVMASSTSKTYMQGASKAMDALGSGDPRAMQRFAEDYVGSFVPNLLRQAGVPAVDQYMREVNSVVDNVLNRTVGFSDKLEARRNLLGEKVLRSPGFPQSAFLPFTLAFNKRDALDDLVILGRAMPMPPEKIAKGEIDLKSRSDFSAGTSPRLRNQSPYDRQLELMNTKLRGGKTLREAIEKIVASNKYKKAPSGGAFEKGGVKYQLVERMITKYQERAWKQVLKEYPALSAKVHEFDRIFKKDSREDQPAAPNIFDLTRQP